MYCRCRSITAGKNCGSGLTKSSNASGNIVLRHAFAPPHNRTAPLTYVHSSSPVDGSEMNPAMGSESPAGELLARFAATITVAIGKSPHHVPLFLQSLQSWPRQARNESPIAATGNNAPTERRPSELQISQSARMRSAMHHQPAPLKSKMVAAPI